MAGVNARWFPSGLQRFLMGNLEWDATDTFNIALLADTYSFDPAHTSYSTHAQSHLAQNTQPLPLANKTVLLVPASSLSVWQASTSYQVGDVVKSTGAQGEGRVFRCVAGGVSGASEPVWEETSWRETEDNAVVWVENGTFLVCLDADDLEFAGSFTVRQAVMYSQDHLVGWFDFGENVEITTGTLTFGASPQGFLRVGGGAAT